MVAPQMIDAVIMAHPARTEQALRLAGPLNARIIWDIADDEWDTGARAWSAINPDADWGLVLQDDAIPVPHLMQHLASLELARTCTSLYFGRTAPFPHRMIAGAAKAREAGAAWIEAESLFWGPAVLLPAEHIPSLLAWSPRCSLPYDQRIGAYYRRHLGLRVRYTWPSLVDHDETHPSLLDHDCSGPRKAHTIGIPTRDGPTVRI